MPVEQRFAFKQNVVLAIGFLWRGSQVVVDLEAKRRRLHLTH